MRLGALVLLAVLAGTPAAAHKVVAAAYVAGDMIEGEIGFSDGVMASGLAVAVFDGAGNPLGETETDETGFFVWRPSVRVDHVFRADLGAGHVAEARVAAADLPATVGAGAPPGTATPSAAAPAIARAAAPPASDAAAGPAALSAAQMTLVAEAVRAELRPLRREIAAYKEKNDLQAILGGLGYILGVFGLGFYLAARRRLARG